MNETILRSDTANLPPGGSLRHGFTWWALYPPHCPPIAVGRTPKDAEDRALDELLDYYRRDSDPLPDDPDQRAADELRRVASGALLSGSAPDELTAFRGWASVSALVHDEAVRLWRAAFPAPVGEPDPLLLARPVVALVAPPVPAVGGHRLPVRSRRVRPGGACRAALLVALLRLALPLDRGDLLRLLASARAVHKPS